MKRPKNGHDELNEYIDFLEAKKTKRINWKALREKYFRECTYKPLYQPTSTSSLAKISFAPHDLFEWFKKNLR